MRGRGRGRERGGKASKQSRADDACSARKCPETGKKDGEREGEGRNVGGSHKGFLFGA